MDSQHELDGEVKLGYVGRLKSPSATENLLENTAGPVFSRGGSLLPSMYPDARYADAVVVHKGIGWQLNNIPSHYSHLETYEIEEAQILKKLRPSIKVSVLRNTEVATIFWDTAKEKMFDPTTQDWWTQCENKAGGK